MQTLLKKEAINYYERKELNHSRLKKLEVSYKEYEKQDDSISEALIMGSLVHESVLEPEIFETRNEATFKTVTSKGFMQEYKEQGLIIPQGKKPEILKARDAILSHPATKDLLQGNYEVEFYEELFGHECKGKVDVFNLENRFLNDLKTTNSVSVRNYEWFVKNSFYHTQMAFYRELIKAKYGVEVDCYLTVYGWKEDDVVVLKLTDDILRDAMWTLTDWFDKLNEVELLGGFKGISPDVIEI